jgi:hypothetical protein
MSKTRTAEEIVRAVNQPGATARRHSVRSSSSGDARAWSFSGGRYGREIGCTQGAPDCLMRAGVSKRKPVLSGRLPKPCLRRAKLLQTNDFQHHLRLPSLLR